MFELFHPFFHLFSEQPTVADSLLSHSGSWSVQRDSLIAKHKDAAAEIKGEPEFLMGLGLDDFIFGTSP